MASIKNAVARREILVARDRAVMRLESCGGRRVGPMERAVEISWRGKAEVLGGGGDGTGDSGDGEGTCGERWAKGPGGSSGGSAESIGLSRMGGERAGRGQCFNQKAAWSVT